MGFKEEMEEFYEELAAHFGDEVPLLPKGIRPVGRYSEYDGGDETAECDHKNIREIHLLTSTIKECIDCGKELK